MQNFLQRIILSLSRIHELFYSAREFDRVFLKKYTVKVPHCICGSSLTSTESNNTNFIKNLWLKIILSLIKYSRSGMILFSGGDFERVLPKKYKLKVLHLLLVAVKLGLSQTVSFIKNLWYKLFVSQIKQKKHALCYSCSLLLASVPLLCDYRKGPINCALKNEELLI